MKKYQLVVLFLIINFGALGISNLFMGNGPTSDWYVAQAKAPWTPPGWFIGIAWTVVMICFSFYMANLVKLKTNVFILSLFMLQFLLNMSWSYIFFNKHLVFLALISISLLTSVIAVFLFKYKPILKTKTWLITPYFAWLLLATSLNIYILLNN
ncbi:tryptophan-rich sensory protein [Xanthomarina sp. F1114]|uniref:TspO/MBR family protein n=1 Tax=Xanthomarina sp. F1114 TaxID=2996019 RepID=UPI00225E61E9|nr:TspO/MBR family protein [Xanthomarina sp. F1114]MCX7549114.1 tryptophan-rich sensory protein [Xanthomarina sp. F1114]